ncbi:MAG: SUMF1/EgtB/PvdO family nonheme iron enzyme [Planctomycetales bacterium]|nr:SUMF1/EgtB/PvdO family nonheme iron enzyme [Planctomycetales bacterium]
MIVAPISSWNTVHLVTHSVLSEDPLSPSRSLRRKTNDGTVKEHLADESRNDESNQLHAVARERSTSPLALVRSLKGDLDNLAMMAIQKDPTRRYSSAQDLHTDIDRYFAKLPLRACGDSLFYVAAKFLQRHLTAALLSVAVLILLIFSIAGVQSANRKLEMRRRLAEQLPLILELRDSRQTLDRCEVTNAEFQKFIDQGGYESPGYWPTFFKDGKELSFADGIKRFCNPVTSEPAPSTWPNGVIPAGLENHPVHGISWYEASAYAKFRGKMLPTLYHWYAAADIRFAAAIVPQSNCAGHNTIPVGESHGIGPFGTEDMAGNVCEIQRIALDYRRSLDIAEQLPELIDSSKIAYYGYSWGAMLGPLLTSIDDRCKAAVLHCGGASPNRANAVTETSNFFPYVRTPTLMVNCRYDAIFPQSAQEAMFNNFRLLDPTQKEHLVYNTDYGHCAPREGYINQAQKWLDHHLGEPKRASN